MDPGLHVEWHGKDGDRVVTGTKFGIVTGSARSILRAERVALNFMQRMSGVATATAAMVDAVAVGSAAPESGHISLMQSICQNFFGVSEGRVGTRILYQ